MNMQPGLISLPPMTDRIIPDAQNSAWDDLGQRRIMGVVLHRQIGTNWGTDGWFRTMWQANGEPGGGQLGLTDLGIDNKTGEILVWNDALGRAGPGVSPNRAGYASGRVSKPYGDGAAFVAKYSVNAVNRDQRSIEIAGNYDSPVSEAALDRIALVIAHDAHEYRIPWDQFPTAPQDGFSFVRWHQEYCIGTGKVCPGTVVMDLTKGLLARAKEIMRRHQTGAVAPTPQPAPTPPPPGPVFVPFTPNRRFHAHAGATGRQYGNRQAPIRKRYADGEEIVTAGYYLGEDVNGERRWLLTVGGGQLRVHASGVKETI